jgi:hypothetical protein
MKRLLFLIMLCVLPLQSSLAAVAEYCIQDSGEISTSHPGHHEHEGQKASLDTPDSVPQADLDCAHHCFPVMVPSFPLARAMDFRRSDFTDLASDFRSAVLDPTERPPLLARA